MYIVSFVDKINAEHLYKKNYKCQLDYSHIKRKELNDYYKPN